MEHLRHRTGRAIRVPRRASVSAFVSGGVQVSARTFCAAMGARRPKPDTAARRGPGDSLPPNFNSFRASGGGLPMKPRKVLSSCVALLALASALALAQAPAPRRLALVGGMLIDGYDGVPPIHRAAILIEGDRIVRVGPASEVTIPPGTEVVDTSGRVMLPGLIDVHVHLNILGHGDYDRWDPWIAK